MDRLIEVRRLPDANSDAFITREARFPGGAAGSVAAAMQLAGRRAGVVAAVGRDAAGRTLTEELTQRSVDTARVRLSDRPTSEILCIMDSAGNRSCYLNPNQAAVADESELVANGLPHTG